MEFKNFKLHQDLQKGIDEAGYINCMPVQEQVLSNAFGGQDLYVQSQTGTGKTAAFLIVIFQRMLTEEALFKRKALIMAPTRELAVQIEEEAKMLGKYLPFKTGSFYGGVGYAQQEKLLRENAQILVGTPGRVLDLNKSGRMNLMDIAFLVLDEADRMFDMGFYPDLRKLIRVVPAADRRQTMLFSATLNAWVKNLAWEYTKSPFEIEIKPEIVTVEEITQILYHVPSQDKMPFLLGILKREQPESVIIFCNTRKYTEIVAKRLKINGYACEFIIGDLPKSKRLKIINDLKAGKIKTLVATDVAARGLDIESLSMVINYDLPVEAENYVHRIGRTARAGKTGKAITLASEQDVYELPAIERYIGKKIPSEIAVQDLYEEDKSSGVRIQSDFYEERQPRDTHGGKRRDAGRKQHSQAPHSSEHRRDAERGGKRRRIPAGQQTGKTRPNEEAQESLHSINKDKQDMSRLSMEERMAHYKKKYAGGEAKHG
jgi:ATP-dependent RNA helicase RhlB